MLPTPVLNLEAIDILKVLVTTDDNQIMSTGDSGNPDVTDLPPIQGM